MSYDPKNHPDRAHCPFCGTVSDRRDVLTAFVETGAFNHGRLMWETEAEGSMFHCEPCDHSFVVCSVKGVL